MRERPSSAARRPAAPGRPGSSRRQSTGRSAAYLPPACLHIRGSAAAPCSREHAQEGEDLHGDAARLQASGDHAPWAAITSWSCRPGSGCVQHEVHREIRICPPRGCPERCGGRAGRAPATPGTGRRLRTGCVREPAERGRGGSCGSAPSAWRCCSYTGGACSESGPCFFCICHAASRRTFSMTPSRGGTVLFCPAVK